MPKPRKSTDKLAQSETALALRRALTKQQHASSDRLTAAQSRFCLLIVVGMARSDAYREAYGTLNVPQRQLKDRAGRLMKLDHIKQGIARREALAVGALAVDKTFILGNLAGLAQQRDDHKAAVRALELLGRHLEPGFFGDNKPLAPIATNPAELMKEIGVIIRELGTLATKRGDAGLAGLVTEATAELIAIAGPAESVVEGAPRVQGEPDPPVNGDGSRG